MPRNRLSNWLAALGVLCCAVTAQAQVTIPNTFSPNTTAQSALVNANFSQVGQQALNRAGGIITGNIAVDPGVTIDGVDIGAVLGGTGTPTFATITTTGAATIGTTLTVSSTSATAITVAGGLTAGSGSVAIIGTTGKIPALTSTYFTSLDGSTITGIAEANITDGSLLARVAANETISGSWTFSAGSIVVSSATGGSVELTQSGAATDEKNILVRNILSSFRITFCNDALNSCADALSVSRTGAVPIMMAINTAITFPNRIAPTTLANGNNNDWAPTGFNTVKLIVATGGTSSKITGIAGGAAGREITLCYATTSFTIEGENTNSTAANRFSTEVPVTTIGPTGASGIPCVDLIYDGTTARWHAKGKLT